MMERAYQLAADLLHAHAGEHSILQAVSPTTRRKRKKKHNENTNPLLTPISEKQHTAGRAW